MAEPALRLVAPDEVVDLGPGNEFVPVEGVKWMFTRNGIYYIVRKVDGKRKPVSLRTRDYDEALRRYRAQVGAEPTKLDGTIRIPAAREEFLRLAEETLKDGTLAVHRDVWRFSEDLLARQRVTDVDAALIDRILDRAEEYISPRTGKPLSYSMLRKTKSALGVMFDSFTKAPTRYRTDNPVRSVRKRRWEKKKGDPLNIPLDEEHIITDEERDLIVAELAPAKQRRADDGRKRQTIVETMHRTGLRINEALGLLVIDIVDGPRYGPYGSLKVTKQIAFGFTTNDPRTWFGTLKGRLGEVGVRTRYVVLSQDAREILDTYITEGFEAGWLQEEGLLFPSLKQTPLSSNFVQRKISQAAKRAGIKRQIKSHFLRHSFATRLFTNGASIEEVALALGNSPKVVSEVYVHFVDRENHSKRMAALAA